MAVQIEARGQIQEFLDVLRRRAWQIAAPAVFVIVIGSCLAVIIPRKFLAQTQLELRQADASSVGKEGQNAKFQLKAPARIKRVVEEQKNPSYLALGEMERRDFLKDVDKNLDVTLGTGGPQSSVFITIKYTDLERGWAGTFLKAIRDDWKDDVLDQDRNKLKDETKLLGNQREKLQKNLEQEEADLAQLKRDSGISAIGPIPGSTFQPAQDPDYDRLQVHKSRAAEVDIQLAKAAGKIASLRKDLQELPEKIESEEVLPGADHAKEIQETGKKIAELQRKLAEYKPAHSKYQQIQGEIKSLESHREELEGLVTVSERTTVMKANPERAKVRGELDEATREASALKAERDSLATTIAEEEKKVESLHDVYRQVRLSEDTINRLRADLQVAELAYQKKITESDSASNPRNNPFAILEEVSVPPKATEPNPWLIVAFSLVAGLGLGVGLAVLLEYTKSCFRSVYDISRVMATPVLGNINTIVTRRESRLRRTRRALVGSASALVLGSLCFVTWAWAHDQETGLLSPTLRRAIEGLRSVLK
jgi:uncharacterized protein involved in exopolysaccharide biosynthesis